MASATILAFALAACGPTTDATSLAEPPTSAAPTALSSTEPVEPDTSGALQAGQTDTEWGRIWDELPAGFPTYPGSTIASDASSEAVSGRFAISGGDPAEIASWLQAALEGATYSTEAMSGPLEDGSYVLDSVGDAACRIETTVAPLGGLTFISVRYGAGCPLR